MKIKSNNGGLRRDVSILKQGLTDLKRDVTLLSFRVDSIEKEIKIFRQEFIDFKDKVYTNLDWLVGAFKKFDEEHSILTGRYSDVNEKLDNHETRIKILEKN